ncbi:MAG: DNA polymerase III subunit beta [Patescibacteria group bacterium]|nr:DNA polymerase III subunit beta [Patescibacteria group bacterium]
MKFKCLSENLSQGLSAVSHAVSTKASLPVLSHILLEARDGSIFLSATNLEISIRTSLPAELEEEGAACLPGRVFTELISSLPKGEISLAEKNNLVTVKSQKTSSKINGLNPSEFPKISVSGKPLFSLNPSVLVQELPKVSFSAATDEGRPVLTGILMEALDGTLTLVGVDGFRLSEKKISVDKGITFKQVVPAKALLEVSRLLSSEDSMEVLLSDEENQIVFKSPSFEICSRLLEGSFPDYKKIIPQNVLTTAEFSVEEMRATLRTVSVFAKDEGSVVKMILNPEKSEILLSASASEVGENEASLFAKITGEAAEVSFNIHYLNDCLANIGEEDVAFRFTGPLTPGIFVPVAKTDYLHLIMPIRVQA